MPFTASKFLSLELSAQHKKIAERLKQYYFEPTDKLFEEILFLEKLMGLFWTQSDLPQNISESFHRHWNKTGLGLSEQALLIKTEDRQEAKREWLSYVIYLDHLRSAENIGSILRTIEAFRLGQVVFSKDMPNLSHPKVQKTSMGTFQKIRSFQGAFEDLPRPWVALETHQKATLLQEFSMPKSCTLFFGNEEFGINPKLLEQMDTIVEIPLVGCKNSLNVAASFSVLAWEVSKQLLL